MQFSLFCPWQRLALYPKLPHAGSRGAPVTGHSMKLSNHEASEGCHFEHVEFQPSFTLFPHFCSQMQIVLGWLEWSTLLIAQQPCSMTFNTWLSRLSDRGIFFYSSAEIQISSITCQLRSTRPVSCDLGENVADLASSSSLATGCHGSKEIVGRPEVVNELQKTKTKALKMGANVSCLLFLLFYDGFFTGV